MKKLLSIGLYLLSAHFLFSQVNYPIPQDSTSEWIIWSSCDDPLLPYISTWETRIFVAGDTTINDKVYSKLLGSGLQTLQYPGITYSIPFENSFYAYIRTDSARTFIILVGTVNEEYLLYDFSLQAGDTLPETPINSNTVVISSIDSVLVGDKYLKRFNIYDSINGDLLSNWYIEGIGHEHGLIEPMYMMLDNGFSLECYAENGIPIFNPEGSPCDLTVTINEEIAPENLLNAYPNPSQGLFNISYNSAKEKNVSIRIIGIRGELIFHSLWIVNKGINEKAIDLSSVNKGIFLIVLEDGTNIIHGKLALTK